MILVLSLNQIQTLRKTTRKTRRNLNRFQLQQAQYATLHKLLLQPQIQFKQHIGIYLDDFGEVPTQLLMLHLFKQHKSVYLPFICPLQHVLRWKKISFDQWRNQRFARHRLGMQQAMQGRGHHISKLDTVIMPLVLFDGQGHRVGMGGGFYDRTLAGAPHHPYRMGLAHDFQYMPQAIAAQPWDQALDQVITPSKIYTFKR